MLESLLRKLRVLNPANLLKGEYCKIFKNFLVKICEQLLLQFLLLTVNISSWVLLSALNSIYLLQRSSSRLKEFSLGCLVVTSSLFEKRKEKLTEMVNRCHSLSLVAPLIVVPYHSMSLFFTRCHSFSLVVPLAVIRCKSLSFVVTRCHSMYHLPVFL